MKVVVRTNNSAIARLSGKQTAQAKIGLQGPAGTSINQISEMTDVDLSAIADGCVLVYSASAGKWIAQTLLNKQQVDMGSESY